MRIALVIVVVLALGGAGAYAAFGRGDDLAEPEGPRGRDRVGPRAPLRRAAVRQGLQPARPGSAARPATTRSGSPSSPAACTASTAAAARVALDLGDRVKLGAEQGLLGIAFHPDFATDRRVYLHWSDPKGDTRVAEFRARRDGTIDPEPLRELLHVDQPEENHNGGQLLFGPDGRLYLGLGDGGGAFDPRAHRAGPGRAARQDPRRRRPAGEAGLGRRPDRPAQPVALLVRRRARRAVDRRRRPGRRRGDRPRAARARRAAQEPRLERLRGQRARAATTSSTTAASWSGPSRSTRTPRAAR